MRKFLILLIWPSLFFGQVIPGVVSQRSPEVGAPINVPPPTIGTTDTLELVTLKASPIAEGAGASARGAFAVGTQKIGLINTNSPGTTTSFLGTFNGVDVYQGSMSGLWQLNDIVIVPRLGGQEMTGGSGRDGDRTYLYGNNVTYFGMLSGKDDFQVTDTKLVFGCPQGEQSIQKCTGQTQNVVFNIKSYQEDPPIGTPSGNDYGRTGVEMLGSIDQGFFANWNVAYGGDQVWDITTTENVAAGFPEHDYTHGNITRQHCIMGNGYGTGSLIGGNNRTGDITDIDGTKNLWINIAYRMPNYRDGDTMSAPYHTWNDYVYNHWGTARFTRIEEEAKVWIKNNVIRAGSNSDRYNYDEVFKWGGDLGDEGDLDVSGNVVIPGYPYNPVNDREIITYFKGPEEMIVDPNDMVTNSVPETSYWLIDTDTSSGIADIEREITSYAGAKYAVGTNGERVSNQDELMTRWLNDATNYTNSSWNNGLNNEDTSNAFIPTLDFGGHYPDSNNNLIADVFESEHSLVADPFATKTYWTFQDHGGYTVENTAGYTNVEMFAFWINDYFWQLISRGEVSTDTTYEFK